jgi:hypothetical protein
MQVTAAAPLAELRAAKLRRQPARHAYSIELTPSAVFAEFADNYDCMAIARINECNPPAVVQRHRKVAA